MDSVVLNGALAFFVICVGMLVLSVTYNIWKDQS